METAGIVIGAIVLFGGLFLFQRIRAERLIAKVPMHTVASAPDGALVRIFGIVKPLPDAAPLIAPFSNTPCLGYELVAKYTGEGKEYTDARWVVSPLLVMDETGFAVLSVAQSCPRPLGGKLTVDFGFFDTLTGVKAEKYPAVRTFGRDKIDAVSERVLVADDRVEIFAMARRDGAQLVLQVPPAGELWSISVQQPLRR